MTILTCTYKGWIFTVDQEPDDPAYYVDFPDLRDIITSGDSLAEAVANACEALDLHLDTLTQFGEPIPQPRHRLVQEAVVPA
jgi:predicted RNase H-like HicB family nuclease